MKSSSKICKKTKKTKGERNSVTTDARTRATPVTALRSAARSQAAAGTRLVFQELPRGHVRRRHAPGRAGNGKRSVFHDGVRLLGTGLLIPQPRPVARRPVF